MKVVVLSFLSLDDVMQDDVMQDEHLHFSKEDPRHNFLLADEEGLIRHLVEHFSPPGGTILDLTGLEGAVHAMDIATN